MLGSLVDLDVFDNQVAGVKALGVGIGFGIPQQAKDELSGLDGPACSGDTELFAWIERVSVDIPKAPIGLMKKSNHVPSTRIEGCEHYGDVSTHLERIGRCLQHIAA